MDALVRLIRFGAFELDARAGELRKHGLKIRLQEQPFRILTMLLEHPGEVVLREEIRLNLWPDDTVVEFDHSINAAVKKLRDALGESAQKPRYIETVSKRGYRFIGEVTAPSEAPAEAPKIVEDQLSPQPAARLRLQLPPVLDAAERQPPPRRRAVALAATLALLGALGVALVLWAGGAGLRVTRSEEPPPHLVPLTAFAGTQVAPSFSPDGNQVVFSWDGEKQDNPDLYVKMIGNSAVLRLTTDPAPDVAPAWSPDGRQIAFLKGGQRRGIYLISPIGGPEQKISDLVVGGGAPAWSPDGKFLMVGKNNTDERTEANEGALFLVPVRGGDPQLALAAPPGQSYRYPAFSPDGRSLAFVSCGGPRQWSTCNPFLVALNADWLPQGKPRQLTAVGDAIVGVAWMPDGRSLLYSTRFSPRGWTLFRIDVAPGSEPRPLEIAASGAQAPAVARQGHRLAFSRQIWNTDVWRLQTQGTPQPLLVSKVADQGAQFSPDGRRIAFLSNRGSQGAGVWLANADGTGVVELVRDNLNGGLRWSPDGLRIAYEVPDNDGRAQVAVVDSSGGRPLQVTSGPVTSAVPTWSHDGKWMYFGSDRTGRFEIWRMPSHGGAAEQITRGGGFLALESVDGKTIYYTKTSLDGPLFSQSFGGGEEKQVLARVVNRGIAVFEDGIYYFAVTGPMKFEIRFHEFATGRSRVISPIEGPLFNGLSVSPDRKTFLFTLVANAEIDLWMIENFR
jgi:Tol biopolymer transport system component/DNA-binding winged helix-turn-helix (wHTH) protein